MTALELSAGIALKPMPPNATSAKVAPTWLTAGWKNFLRRMAPVLASAPGRIWLCALFAVLTSCYPVAFLGKSFMSPNFVGVPLLYPWHPTVPGSTDAQLSGVPGSDLGAMHWQNMPYSVVQSRALLGEGAFPFWNRYNSCGVPLFGQSTSMLADPLHLPVVLAGGATWAWDVKFLLAKLLFAAGVGFAVRAATGHLPVALLLTVSSAFLGFFSYRFNHPAFFTLCYAPWILVCWLHVVRAGTVRGGLAGATGLLLANGMVMTSGTAKEAYMLLFGLNGTGLLAFCLTPAPRGVRRGQFLHLLAAGGIFVLLSAPVWVTFLDTLRQSWTIYEAHTAWQIPPSLFVGLFDNLFHKPFAGEMVFNPSANFLLLLGGLYLLVNLRRQLRDRVCLSFALGAIVPLALVFGVIPPGLIAAVPFLNGVVHVDNTFSCVFIVQLFVLAGFGFRAAAERLRAAGPRWRGDLGMVALGLGVILGVYGGGLQAKIHGTRSFLGIPGPVLWGDFLPAYAATLVLASLVLPVAVRRVWREPGRRSLYLGLFAVCFCLLHWRHGQHLPTPFAPDVISPPVRANLLAASPSVEFIRDRQADGPSRAVGFNAILFPGFSAALGVETINGPDALMNPHYRGLLEASGRKLVWEWCLTTDKAALPKLQRLYDLFNVRYYLGRPWEADPVAGLTQVGHADLRIYESRTAWPRAFFTNQVEVCADAPALVQRLAAGDGQPFAAVDAATLSETPGLAALRGELPRPAQFALPGDWRMGANETAFTVRTPSAGVVVLSETYQARDFVVTVNGQPAPYFRVNHAFKAVTVDAPGVYHISFRYRPSHWTGALLSAAAGLILLLVWGGNLLRPVTKSAPDKAGKGDLAQELQWSRGSSHDLPAPSPASLPGNG